MKRKMRGGKDEKKQMDPLFPRLHVNDAETGGPRAPPRNKMALCEQVSMPSQRLSSGSVSMQSLSYNNSTNLVSSASLSQVHCHKKNGFSLFCSSPESSHHMTERLNSNSSGGMSLNTKYSEFEILKPGNYQSFSARRPLRMTSECRLLPPCGFYNPMNSSATKHWNEDDIRIHYFGQTEKAVHCGSIGLKMGREKVISSSLCISEKHLTALERQEKEIERNDVKSKEHPRNQAEDNCKVSEMSDDNTETLHPHKLTGENVLINTAPSALALQETCKSGKGALAPTNHKRRTVVNDLGVLHDTCTTKDQKCKSFPLDTAYVDNVSRNPETLSRKRSFSKLEFPSCSTPPPTGDKNRSLNRLESVNQYPKANDAYSCVGDVERNIGMSDSSVVDSRSGLGISPDDLVRVIRPKVFWSVRRTIVHQQRIFAVQLFELHRLIKVQRLIAGSPEILFEDNVILNKPSINCSPEKKLQLENYPEQEALFLKPKIDSQRPKPCLDYQTEEAHRKLPPSTYATENRHVTPRSALKQNSGAQTTSFAPDATFGPWGFPTSPANQWLIPVKSPAEGLIYKPYTGPYPPNAGCITPVYGSCGALSLTRIDGDYLNTVHGVPTTIQKGIGIYTGPGSLGRPSCFQTYSLPVINTSCSSSVVKQTSPFATACSSGMDDHSISTYNICYIVPYRSFYDITGQSRGIMTDSDGNSQASKGSDVFQDSTASNPDEKVQGDALPLFPMTPTVQMSKHPDQNDNTEQQIQVIKAVPHNPKSASESAARIFWSIQEERKQHK